MGFLEQDCVGSRFIDCKILRKPGTERLLSSNADGIVSIRSQATTIERAQIEYTGDDMVNIHSGLQYLVSNGIVLARSPEELQPGQIVKLYDQQGVFQGEEVVRQIREVTDQAIIDQARAEAVAFGLLQRVARWMEAFEVEFEGDVAGPRLLSNNAALAAQDYYS